MFRRLCAILTLSSAALLLTQPASSQSAEELIPFEKLEPKLRAELWAVTKKYTIRRKAKDRTVACDSVTFHYLLSRLPLASKLVRHLELGDYEILAREGGGFSLDDKEGAFANCRIVHHEAERLVVVARGFVETGMIPKVKGTGVIIVRTKEERKASAVSLKADCRVYFRMADKSLHMATKPFRKQLGGLLEERMAGFIDCASTIAARIEKDPKAIFAAMQALKLEKSLLEDFEKRFLSAKIR